MAYTYIVQCADGTFYTGWTTNLETRVAVHNSGSGARYTRSRLPVTLIYYELQPDESQARKREYAIKLLSRKEKEVLVAGFTINNVCS
ncbi:GIY-YIG nuclease family protein [Sporomusa sp.]|uniref:GIY-YIG nuclease family protein n=1 Tax=Sporomusa sp. TaxID=2078658 RepID=UPI002C4D74F9|nr:GIY-YIG nuclease family protein [Sporomusa sp.]HWR05535.1 GIY-YIG nuclease family protein [Sporomusa sp.]